MTDIPPTVPRSLIENRSRVGAASIAWLAELPEIIATVSHRWSLTLGPPFPRLSYNYAAPVTLHDGTEAVLKLCPPDPEFTVAVTALCRFPATASVRVIAHDLTLGALLLERLTPGTPIIDLSDDRQATGIALDVMQRLWTAPPLAAPVPNLADWFRGFDNLTPLFPGITQPSPDLLRRTELLVANLLATSSSSLLLHGDLNYGNVLSSHRGWLAIDPHGVIGDPVFDTAILLHDPEDRILSAPDAQAFLARRVDQIATTTGFDYSRVRDWGIAYAVLSAVWTAEDGRSGWDGAIACALLLESL
jgi:streptomycin 6-kinase